MSDETKPCPNPECEDGKIKSAWFEDTHVYEAWIFCGCCETRGPRAKAKDLDAVAAEARRLWNALPRAMGPGEATRRVFEWPAIDRWAVAALSVLAKSGDRAVRGESAAEAFRRGKMEGYKLSVVDLLRRLGAVDVVAPTSCDHVGFAIGYGPGDATRRILSTLDRKQAEAAKTTEEYTLYVWPSPWGDREITYETVTAALRECGMEDEP